MQPKLYKRGEGKDAVWWVYIHHNGQAIRKSAGTADKKLAQQYAAKLQSDCWQAGKLDKKPAVTWDVVALDWLEHKQGRLRDYDTRRDQMRWLQSRLTGLPLDQITRAKLKAIWDEVKLGRRVGRYKQRAISDSTANAYVAQVICVLRYAVEREWLGHAPQWRFVKRPALTPRWITEEQAERLVAALPAHVAWMVYFSLATGLRRNNVLRLRWDHIDLTRRLLWVDGEHTKNGKPLNVPLSDAAIEAIRSQLGKHTEYVFTYNGRPIAFRVGDGVWTRACKVAGLKNFRWHDLRHTWASWHVQRGTPLAVLQELGGWSSLAMVQRYARLGQSHLAHVANNGGLPPKAPVVSLKPVQNLHTTD
jgi:integrase